MNLSIIAILRVVAAAALPPLAALACAAPAPTIAPTATPTPAPTATPPCEGDEPDCLPHPLDLLALAALYQSVK